VAGFSIQLIFNGDRLMKILYINNDGAGFADYIEVAQGTTVATLFASQVPHGKG
jgi:hypothetical protein